MDETGELGETDEVTGGLSEGGIEVSEWKRSPMKQRSKPKNAMGWSKIRRLEDGAAADSNDGEAYVSGCIQ